MCQRVMKVPFFLINNYVIISVVSKLSATEANQEKGVLEGATVLYGAAVLEGAILDGEASTPEVAAALEEGAVLEKAAGAAALKEATVPEEAGGVLESDVLDASVPEEATLLKNTAMFQAAAFNTESAALEEAALDEEASVSEEEPFHEVNTVLEAAAIHKEEVCCRKEGAVLEATPTLDEAASAFKETAFLEDDEAEAAVHKEAAVVEQVVRDESISTVDTTTSPRTPVGCVVFSFLPLTCLGRGNLPPVLPSWRQSPF